MRYSALGGNVLVRLLVAIIVAAVILWLVPLSFAWVIALLAFLIIFFGAGGL